MSVTTVNMFKSDVPFRAHTFMQSITPLIHCSVNNALIKTTPLFNQSFFQMVDVTDLAAVDSFLQNAPYRVVHQIGSGLFSGQSSGLMKSAVSANSSAIVSQARWVGWGNVLMEAEEVTRD